MNKRTLNPLNKPNHIYKVRIKLYANMINVEYDDFESAKPASDLFYNTPDHHQIKCVYYEKFVWTTYSFVTVQAKNIFIKNFYELTWKNTPEIQDLS